MHVLLSGKLPHYSPGSSSLLQAPSMLQVSLQTSQALRGCLWPLGFPSSLQTSIRLRAPSSLPLLPGLSFHRTEFLEANSSIPQSQYRARGLATGRHLLRAWGVDESMRHGGLAGGGKRTRSLGGDRRQVPPLRILLAPSSAAGWDGLTFLH